MPTTEELLARIEALEGNARTRSRRRGVRIALSVVALAALLAVPIGVFASHSFTDVPNSNTFHAQIGRVKGAGITAGCTATTYCPTANVTRGQMAAFLARSAGRVAHVTGGNTLPDNSADVVVASLTIKPGDVTGGTANIAIDANILAYVGNGAACPCSAAFVIYVNGEGVASFPSYASIGGINYSGGIGMETTGVAVVAAVPTGVNATVEVRGYHLVSTQTFSAIADLTATYVPFGSDGSNATVAAPVKASDVDPKDKLHADKVLNP
jgi:hypothetical protein